MNRQKLSPGCRKFRGMTNDTFKVTIHMVSSLDGMIAKKDNSVSWFETPDFYEKGAAQPDAAEFLKTIDCYVMAPGHMNMPWSFQDLMGGPMETHGRS